MSPAMSPQRSEKTKKIKIKESRPSVVISLNAKVHKTARSKPAQSGPAVSINANISDDEDDVPLILRRAFAQKHTTKDSSMAVIDTPRAQSNTSTHRQQHEPKDDPFDCEGEPTDTYQPSEESSKQHSDSILSKLSHYMDILDSDIDNTLLQKDISPHSLLLRIQEMRKFTTYALKAGQYKCIQRTDLDQFGRVMKMMEFVINNTARTEIISEHAKLMQTQTHAMAFQTTMNALKSVYCTLETSVMTFEILTCCRLDYQLLSEELITTCLQFVKNLLENIIYPLVDQSNITDDATCLNRDILTFTSFVETIPKAKALLTSLLPLITRFLGRSFVLLQQDDLDDDMVVILAYISVGPIFHEISALSLLTAENSTDNPFEQVKIGALDMLQALFSNYPLHRRWILEEILSNLNGLTTLDRGTKTYRLKNNATIHIVSALFMQLVQCCCVVSDHTTHQGWLRKWEIKYQKVEKNDDRKQMRDLDDKLIKRASDIWKKGTEAAAQSATFFLEFIMAKCKSKKRDVYSLEEYRAILGNTLQDVMDVLNDPEWPAAELILRVFTKILVAQIESKKADTYLKSIAIEWLGIITSRIKVGCKQISGDHASFTPEWIYELNEKLPKEINKDTTLSSFTLLEQCREKMLNVVGKQGASTPVLQFYFCTWGYTNSLNLLSMQTNISEEIGEPMCSEDMPDNLRSSCKKYWLQCLNGDAGQQGITSQYEFPPLDKADVLMLSEVLASRQVLYMSANFLLSKLMSCLDKEAVSFRTKALRALGHMAAEVPEIMDELHIRSPIVLRVHDSSPSVRDAAVEVIAKYLGRQQSVPIDLYKIVSSRIMDTASNVRKRLVKLLRDLYFKCGDTSVKIDIASKLIHRIADNDIAISDLALKVTQEVLFQPFQEIQNEDSYFGHSYQHAPKEKRRRIMELTDIITDAVAKLDPSLSTRNAMLAKIVQKTVETCNDKQRSSYEGIFQWIVDYIFERMLALDENGEADKFVSCLATVYAFTHTCADLLRETQIATLQPYLSVTESDDWKIACYVLTIYKDVLPRIKHHDPDFIEMVERALLQLLMQCPLQVIEYAVPCLCTMVEKVSSHYNLLIKMLASCTSKLKQDQDNILNQGLPVRSAKNIAKLLLICGSLCQHFDFDAKRSQEPAKMIALDAIHSGSVVTFVYQLVLSFTVELKRKLNDDVSIRLTALQSLGFIFASNPMFMISDSSTMLLDQIFEDGSLATKVQLMRVLCEFLAAEEIRIEKREESAGATLYTKVIDVETLLGNTAEFAELGVNGSLMQRYLRKILECALDRTPELRRSAFEVISAIMNQGLAHPVLCMPVIVASETSPDTMIRNKAYHLHKYAHEKYGSLLYSQFSDYLHTSFEYQKATFGSHPKGWGNQGGDTKVESLFGLAYSILKEKKKIRHDFLVSLIKPFEFDLKDTRAEELDPFYFSFLSDAILTMDFTQSDELLCIIHAVNRIVTTLGADLLAYVQFLRKEGVLSIEADEFCNDPLDKDYDTASKAAIALVLLLCVRERLMELYDLSEEDVKNYNPKERQKSHGVTRDLERQAQVDWADTLSYFKTQRLNQAAAADACDTFEGMIMRIAIMDGAT